MVGMTVERCDECGFDGGAWTDEEAIQAIAELPNRWRGATHGLDRADATRRSLTHTWSVAEYADHVREVLFGMRFLLDSAASQPGVDLGPSPDPSFDPEPRELDLARALGGIEREAKALAAQLASLAPGSWRQAAVVDGEAVDAHWVCRHAVHDATHHLMDVARVRAGLSDGT
jgi:hypothetical protein